MDSDRMLEFESAYKSICKRLETLRSIYASNQKVNRAGNPENGTGPSTSFKTGKTGDAEKCGILCRDPVFAAEISGEEKTSVGCSANAEELLADHPTDPAKNDVVNVQGGADQTPEETCEMESAVRLNKSLRSPQPKEILREQAQKWICEQIVGVFEEHSGNMSKIGTLLSDNDMSCIVKSASQILQERVDQIEAKAKRVTELRKALSKEKNAVDSMQQKRLVLQGLLDQAFSSAEYGIFMCRQCQHIAEITEPLVHTKMEPGPTSFQVIVNGEMEICCNVNNLQSKRGSNITSVNCLLDRQDGKSDSLVAPLVQGTNNVASRLCNRIVSKTHQMHHGHTLEVADSKLVNVDERRVKPELKGDSLTNSVPPLKRKSIDDGSVEKGESLKAPKLVVQTSELQCSNGSKESDSTKPSEKYYTNHLPRDIFNVPDFVYDHDKQEHKDNSMGQATTFTLVLEEEFDDDLE